jgi:hypothetical protein
MSWLNPGRSSNSRTRVRLPPACRRQVRRDSRSPETDLQGSLKGKLKGLVWLLTHSGINRGLGAETEIGIPAEHNGEHLEEPQ